MAPRPWGKRLTGRSSRLCIRQWAANGLGVESCGKVLMPLVSSGGTREGAFLKEERTLVASSQSSCTNHFCVPLSGAEEDAVLRESRDRDSSPQKQLESPGARWSLAGLERAGRTGGRRSGSAKAHTLPRLRNPPASWPADASIRGRGSQRGGIVGQDSDSGIVRCARLSRRLCALARSARPRPRRPGTSATPKKLCRESSKGCESSR